MNEHIHELVLDSNKSRAVDECNAIVCFERAVSSNALFDGECRNYCSNSHSSLASHALHSLL
jgi:hypothetical protein